ncbi:LPS assembly lipoprotein LptE [Paracoccaceae bacterium]|nr:LPS assembly lipoprotein LptE [Paracoccaceae bacterium]
MLLYNRRRFGVVLAAAALAGCGFTPVYGPDGTGAALLGQLSLDPPQDRNAYLLRRRIEERLGQATAGAWRLSTQIKTDDIGLVFTTDGDITRYNINGTTDYTLRRTGSSEIFRQGKIQHFTSYSATGTTVATLAAKRDAEVRLMTILADQIIDQLLIISEDLQP